MSIAPIGIRLAMIADFDPDVFTKEEANKKIAYRLQVISEMYEQCLLLAEAHDIKIMYQLKVPEAAVGGHNTDTMLYWNPSSKYC